MKISPARVIGTAALIALAVTGCGTTESPQGQGSGQNGEPITITDGRGVEVTLENGPAQNVVTLEWMQTEAVVSLGVDPVAVADPEGYASWVGEIVPLRNDPVDVGLRTEPNIDALTALDVEIDLIVGVVESIPENEIEAFEQLAPVALFEGADADDPVGHVFDDFETIATLLGEEDTAAQIIADYEENQQANAQAIEDAGLAGRPFVFVSAYADGSNLTIRMHGPRTGVQEVAADLGLEAAWEDPGDDAYGLSSTDLEGLTTLPDDTILLYWGNADNDDALAGLGSDNAIWNSLPFVQAGDVHRAGVGIWAYGGPASLSGWSDDIVAQLTQ